VTHGGRHRRVSGSSTTTTSTTAGAARDQSPDGKSSSSTTSMSLAHIVPRVCRLGNESSSHHMEAQIRCLLDEFREGKDASRGGGVGEGFSCVADEGHRATEAVASMLRRLRDIGADWRHALPANAYCKAIGL